MVKSVLLIFVVQCFYVALHAAELHKSSRRSVDSLPPLVPPKFHDDDDFEERDIKLNEEDGIINNEKNMETYKLLMQLIANNQDNKRSMGMLRMGRSSSDDQMEDAKRTMSMLRMGRSMGMLRMGRGYDDNKRSMGMLRMGRGFNLDDAKETSSDDKRSMGMLRMGRSSENEVSKKSMGMLRMGKRSEAEIKDN